MMCTLLNVTEGNMKSQLVLALIVALLFVVTSAQEKNVLASSSTDDVNSLEYNDNADKRVSPKTLEEKTSNEEKNIASSEHGSTTHNTTATSSGDSNDSLTKKFRENYEHARKEGIDIDTRTKEMNRMFSKGNDDMYKPVKTEPKQQSNLEGYSVDEESEPSIDESPKDWDTVESSLQYDHDRNTHEVEEWGERKLREEHAEAREQAMARAEYERGILEEERKELVRRKMREMAVNHHIALARRHEMAARILEGRASSLDEKRLAASRLLRGSPSAGRQGFLFGDQWLEGYQRPPPRYMPPAEPPAMMDLNEELANPLQVPSYPVPDSPALDELESNHVELLTPIDVEDHLPGERHDPGASDISNDGQLPPDSSTPSYQSGQNDPYNIGEQQDNEHGPASSSMNEAYDGYDPYGQSAQ